MQRLMVVVTVTALSLVPLVAAAHEGAEVAIVGHSHPDGPIEIKGSDFEPGEVVGLELRKQGQAPVRLGSVPVEPDGTFEATLHVPAEVRRGLYDLVASVGDESTAAEATILDAEGAMPSDEGAPVEDISNERPVSETAALSVVTAILAAAGGGIIVLGRRERARPLPS